MKNIYSKLLFLSTCFLSQGSLSAQCAAQSNLSSATNMVGLIRNNSSAISASKDLNTIVFIHRNHVATFGGNSGNLRIDVSTNGGSTWASNVGPVNPLSPSFGRYPNVAIYNPAANTNTANAYISYLAPTVNTLAAPAFNGDVSGVATLNGTGITENYNQNGLGTTLLPASLVKGAPGVFWAVEPLAAANGFNILKGVWNSGISDVAWGVNFVCMPGAVYMPSVVNQDYTIAFDPTGTTGYVCFTGNMNSNPAPQTLYPILYKTVNGGASWTGPTVVDVTKFSCIASNTVSPNFPSVNINHDMVVDVNGNPHIITTLGNSSFYAFNYSLWHHMYDITLKNGLWIANDLGNVNCAETIWGGTTTFAQAQAPQASRTADGTKIFFTWTDNSASSLGSANTSPNLFGKAYNVTNNTWTQTKDFTSCNPAAAGKILFPKISPEALEPNATTYLVPAMHGDPSVVNDLDQTANFRYLDNVTFTSSEFSLTVPPATVTIEQGPLAVLCPSGATLSVAGIGEAIWNTGVNSMSLGVTTGTATAYSVTAQVGCNVGTATISVLNLTINPSVVSTNICPGEAANFAVLGNALGYTWTPGGATGNNVILNPMVNTITLTAEGSNSCITTQTLSANLLPVPNISIAGNNTICAGTVLSQTATGGATYEWGDGSTNATFTDTPTTNTMYTVIGTAANSCTNTQTVSVVVKPAPSLTLTSTSSSICLGDSTLLGGSGAVTYSWNGVSSTPGKTVSPTATGIYTLTGAGANLCTSSKTINITVFALPSLTVTQQRPTFCIGERIRLNVSGASSYTWVSPGALTNSVQVTPTVTTIYTVTGVNSNGCVNTFTYSLAVSKCTGIGESNVDLSGLMIYPNPNNGSFTIKSDIDLSLNIINELGQMVRTISLTEMNQHEVSVQDLSGGIYFLMGQDDKTTIKQKILIAK